MQLINAVLLMLPLLGILVVAVIRWRKYPQAHEYTLRFVSIGASSYVLAWILVQHYWH